MSHTQDPTNPALLQGLRVLDLTRNLPGPFATRMLADLGAEIIKVEPPEGDPGRQLGSLFDDLNRGKECRRIDFKQPEGIAQLRQWVSEADVVLEGFRPGVMDSMGLGFDALKAIQPKIVMCSITGYGQQGPWAQRAGHDINYMAMSGVLDQVRSRGEAADGDPAMSNVQWGDIAGGSSMACIAILAAVFDVQRRGTARYLDVSMTHGLHAHLVMPKATGALLAPMLGRPPRVGEDMLNGALPCYGLYKTADGRWLAVGSLEHKFWRAACEAMQQPDWANQHWQRGLLPNTPESDALRDKVAALVASHPLSHWAKRFENVDACVTPVLTLGEACAHVLFAAQPRQPWAVE